MSQNGYSQSTDEGSLLDWINQFVTENFGFMQFEEMEQNETFQELIQDSYNYYNFDSLVNGINSDYASGYISQNAYNYLISVTDILNTLTGSLTPDVIQNKINSIKAIETDVLASDINETDKKYVLVQTSVSRYSLYYWYNKEYVESSQSVSASTVAPLSSSTLKSAVGADVRGAGMAISSGFVEWASFFGPEATAIAFFGTAAVFSANAL